MKRPKLSLLAAVSSLTFSVAGGYALPAASQSADPLPDEQRTEAVEQSSAEQSSAEQLPAETADEAEAEQTEAEQTEDGEEKSAPRLTEAQRIRRKLLIQGDLEYAAGNFASAQAFYRQAKDESWLLPQQLAVLPPEPFTDEALLSPGGSVYWREAKAGIADERPAQTLVALELLSSQEPAFIPGHLQYAAVLRAAGRPDEASAVLEQALTQYPAQADLLLAQVDLHMSQKQWLEAAIASRQFVALNGDHAAAPAQAALATENMERFQRKTRGDIREGAIANAFTGILGYALTGGILGPFTAASSAIMLLQGENNIGSRVASQVQQQLPMLEQPEALGYVRRIGNRLAATTGRNDLDYEFFVILDPDLNAFALPGGKVFINAGAILKTHSEAELAGLMAHEISHSVLSHGFQLATRGNLSSSVAQYLPYGGLINNVFLSGYSRKMERQADIVGTQILAAAGYAADGTYNVMVTLNEEAEDADGYRAPAWISSHPNPEDRVAYLQNLVERGGYNRYAYEGVASHEEIQAIVARQLTAYEAREKTKKSGGSEATEAADEAEAEETQTDLYDAVERFDW